MEYKLDNVEIVKIYSSDKDRDGKPYVSKKGNAFSKIDIYIDPRVVEDPDFEGKMTYFDYFGNMDNYGQGTTLTGVVKRAEVGDRVYFNFELPATGKKALELDIKEINERVKKLEDAVFGGKSEVQEAMEFTKEALKEEPEENDESLPF